MRGRGGVKRTVCVCGGGGRVSGFYASLCVCVCVCVCVFVFTTSLRTLAHSSLYVPSSCSSSFLTSHRISILPLFSNLLLLLSSPFLTSCFSSTPCRLSQPTLPGATQCHTESGVTWDHSDPPMSLKMSQASIHIDTSNM